MIFTRPHFSLGFVARAWRSLCINVRVAPVSCAADGLGAAAILPRLNVRVAPVSCAADGLGAAAILPRLKGERTEAPAGILKRYVEDGEGAPPRDACTSALAVGSWFDRRAIRAVAVACVLAWSSTPALASSLRCGSRLVSLGDSTHQVRRICGEPNDVTQRSEFRLRGQAVAAPCSASSGAPGCVVYDEELSEIQIDEWIYDLGRTRLLHRLIFEQGALRRVDTLGSRGLAR